jgi:hypothetical protein
VIWVLLLVISPELPKDFASRIFLDLPESSTFGASRAKWWERSNDSAAGHEGSMLYGFDSDIEIKLIELVCAPGC